MESTTPSRKSSVMEHMDEKKFIPVALEIPLEHLANLPIGHDLIIRMRNAEIIGTESINENEQIDQRSVEDTLIRVKKTSTTELPSTVEIFHPRGASNKGVEQDSKLYNTANGIISRIKKLSNTKQPDANALITPHVTTIDETSEDSPEEGTSSSFENKAYENSENHTDRNGNRQTNKQRKYGWTNSSPDEKLAARVKKISTGNEPNRDEISLFQKTKENHNQSQIEIGEENVVRKRSNVTVPNKFEEKEGGIVMITRSQASQDGQEILSENEFNPDDHDTKKLPQLLSAIAASMGAFAFGTVLAWSSTGIVSIQESKEFGILTEGQISWISSIAILGAVFSCPITGFGMGKYGRRKFMMYLTAPFILGWIVIALARNVWEICVGRFLTGLCGGCFSISVPIFTSETGDSAIRGGLGCIFDILLSAGMLYIYVIGQYVDWRLQAGFCALIPIAFHCLIFFIPESPRYLVEKEKFAKAEKAMYWLKGVQTHPELVKWEMSEIRRSVFALKETKFTVRDTFRRPIVKPTLVMFGIMFFTTLSGFDTVIAFTVHIFESAGAGVDPGLSTITIGIVSLLSSLPSSLLVDYAGRKFLLMMSGICMFLSLSALGLFFYVKDVGVSFITVEDIRWLPLTALIAFIISFSSGFGPLHILMIGEILPNHLKGLTSCLALMFRWSLAFLQTNTFHLLVNIITEHGTFWMFAFFSLLSVPFVYYLVPETKNKSCDAIQIYFVKA